MRRIAASFVVVLVGCFVPLASGQDKNVNVGWVYASVPKPGMIKQLEDGRKKHMDFHRKQNDSWEWDVWQIETGDGTGNYLSTTFGHSWADLDAWEAKMGTADTADANANLTPYVAAETASIWEVLQDSSHMPMDKTPPKMAEVNHFLLKPGSEPEFNDAIKKINDAIVKANWGVYYTWYALQDGGEGPHYVLVLYMKGWADLAEPNPSFGAMLEKAVGKHDAEALQHSFDSSVKREWTETLRYRPDLSYVPAGK
jgi:hypothetical protein